MANLVDLDRASDQVLLHQYVKLGSEAAFTQIMRRHYALVYSTCKQEVEDADLAEDVAQVVFLIFARRASTLRGGTGLAGWLFRTACFASKNALRQEQRRRRREHKMAQEEQSVDNREPSDVWGAIEPHLHDVLTRLQPEDREAILMRFFEECSLAEVGARLEVSENTARMRITRALDKMRRHLEREGVALTAVLLTTLLTEKAAAPLTVVPLKPIIDIDNPLSHLSQTTARVHQLMQGVQTAMLIKTATLVTVTTAACITAVALPLLAVSSPTVALRHTTTALAQNVPVASPNPLPRATQTKDPKNPKQAQVTVHFVSVTFPQFLKASRGIPAGQTHDALLLDALIKGGATDTQGPQVQTSDDVPGSVDIGTPLPTTTDASGKQSFLTLHNSVAAKPHFNADGTITTTLTTQSDELTSNITPFAYTSNKLSTIRTFHNGQTLILSGVGAITETTSHNGQTLVVSGTGNTTEATSMAHLIFVKVESVPRHPSR